MLSRTLLTEILHKAMSTGADFAEVYVENTRENTISMVDNKVNTIADKIISGVGIRILKGTKCVSGNCSSLERTDLLACATRDILVSCALADDTRNVRLSYGGVIDKMCGKSR